MSRQLSLTAALGALAVCLASQATAPTLTLVNDTWQDGTRTDPASPIYSEMGVDADLDGLESAWFTAGGNGGTSVASPGHLLMTPPPANSQSNFTYFTPEATPVTLAAAGHSLSITWTFRTADVSAAATGQDFRLAVVDSPAATRAAADAVTPGNAIYPGYAIFGNMAETFGNTNPFQLRERAAPPADNGALLSAGAQWTSLANDGVSGQSGYQDNTVYTLVWSFTRTAANELDISATMTGGTTLDNGAGQLAVNFTDASPNTFTFDTFFFRPSTGGTTSTSFDTTLFRVDVMIPEPGSLALIGMAGLALVARGRRR